MSALEYALFFYILLAISLVLMLYKPLRMVFGPFNTLIHELGHALTCLLFNGKIEEIKINRDSSGHTLSRSRSKFASFLTALAGYPFPLIFALTLFWMNHFNQMMALYTLIAISIVSIILFVRNTFGLFWLIAFTSINVLLLVYANRNIIEFYIVFLAFVLLVSGFRDTGNLWRLALKTPKYAGDATVLRQISGLPALFWAGIFFLMNTAGFLYVVLTVFPFIKDIQWT